MKGIIRLSAVTAIFFFAFFPVLSFALDETLTVTTYYPSPFGSYNELQLYPHNTPVTTCNASTEGTLYYDSGDNQIKQCDGAGNWVNMGGGITVTRRVGSAGPSSPCAGNCIATSSCVGTEQLTGGGCLWGGWGSLSFIGTYPNDTTTWNCAYNGTGSASMTAYALCAQ
jgi:hypothetical protein